MTLSWLEHEMNVQNQGQWDTNIGRHPLETTPFIPTVAHVRDLFYIVIRDISPGAYAVKQTVLILTLFDRHHFILFHLKQNSGHDTLN